MFAYGGYDNNIALLGSMEYASLLDEQNLSGMPKLSRWSRFWIDSIAARFKPFMALVNEILIMIYGGIGGVNFERLSDGALV